MRPRRCRPSWIPAGRPFFGRAEELAWLHEAWADVTRSGHGRLLVIAGPAGSGRTRLVAEFAARLHARGVAVHYGRVETGLAVLDDLDDQSVGQLAAGLPEGPVLCVATYDPTTASAGLRRALLATAHEERVLAPLGRADIAQIVARVAGPVDRGAGGGDRARRARPAGRGRTSRGAADRGAVRAAGGRRRRAGASGEPGVGGGPRGGGVGGSRPGPGPGAARRARRPAWIGSPARTRGWPATSQSDAPLFHGREELVARLCARLVDTTFVAVVGPSGAGKSSLVRAGLLPALAAGVLPGLADAQQHLLAPGAPLPALDGPAVVVVDQFEEVFAAITDDVARQPLPRRPHRTRRPAGHPGRGRAARRLRRSVRRARQPRASCSATAPSWSGRCARTRSAARSSCPPASVGLRSEPALVDAIVSDMQDAPGALPLMSTALVEVWQGRSGATLTAAAYHRAGGVPGALARLAEAAFASLDEPAQAAARRILLRLAETGEGGVLVRRRVPRRELGDDPATARALHELVNRRLLTAGDTGVEVTHEALLTHWPRLAGWLAEDEQGRALRRHLAPAAAEWDVTGRPDAELYRGARLASALDWTGDRLAELTDVERDFLAASRDYADRQLAEETARADRQARARRRLLRRARRRGQPAPGRRRRHLARP